MPRKPLQPLAKKLIRARDRRELWRFLRSVCADLNDAMVALYPTRDLLTGDGWDRMSLLSVPSRRWGAEIIHAELRYLQGVYLDWDWEEMRRRGIEGFPARTPPIPAPARPTTDWVGRREFPYAPTKIGPAPTWWTIGDRVAWVAWHLFLHEVPWKLWPGILELLFVHDVRIRRLALLRYRHGSIAPKSDLWRELRGPVRAYGYSTEYLKETTGDIVEYLMGQLKQLTTDQAALDPPPRWVLAKGVDGEATVSRQGVYAIAAALLGFFVPDTFAVSGQDDAEQISPPPESCRNSTPWNYLESPAEQIERFEGMPEEDLLRELGVERSDDVAGAIDERQRSLVGLHDQLRRGGEKGVRLAAWRRKSQVEK